MFNFETLKYGNFYLMLLNLLLDSISIHLIFLFFIVLKNYLRNPLPNVKKNKVIYKIISYVGAPPADMNDAILILPLVTKRKSKYIYKKLRTYTYIPTNILILFLWYISPIKKSFA